MHDDNRLGEFLTARRARVRPSDHGLPAGGRRRVPGLRREEVAMLAGLSADYYMRLEQGRDRNPSAEVTESLVRVLLLDAHAAAHLRELVGPRRRTTPATPAPPEKASAELRRLMNGWTLHPALILGRRFDVLAANSLGAALFPATNLVRLVFHAQGRAVYLDWDRVARNTVAGLRAAADPADPELRRMVAELSHTSAEFGRLWARHDVTAETDEVKRVNHPDVGEMSLTYQTFTVNGAPGQQLVVYQAEPASPSERSLTLLGIIAADPRGLDRKA